jgi:DNA modification methylase
VTLTVLRADARHLPIPDNTVDLIVTSPPYFGLRSYQDGGQHYDGQVGAEATPVEFLDALIEVTRECVRVLRPSGSLWVNLGDKYAGSNGQQGGGGKSTLAGAANGRARDEQQAALRGRGFVAGGAPTKSLIGIPWRYALRCIDDLGLILRAEVIWAKPNGLPESVTDRVRRSHEQWFHFTLQSRYFSAVDEIREQYDAKTAARYAAGYGSKRGVELASSQLSKNTDYYVDGLTPNPLGKLPGSVWTIEQETSDAVCATDGHRTGCLRCGAVGDAKRTEATTSSGVVDPGSVWTVPTEPLRVPEHLGVDHFAAFPSEFPRRIILGWSPSGVCVECGEGRRPVTVTDVSAKYGPGLAAEMRVRSVAAGGVARSTLGPADRATTITGYACACTDGPPWHAVDPATVVMPPTRPAVVLDPFGGTGTTAHVAHALGRHGISVDLSADYCRLASAPELVDARVRKVLGIDKPPPVMAGQTDLFGDDAA